MTDTKKIVFLDVLTPAMHRALADNVPPGFTVTFANARTEEERIAAVADADYILIWPAVVTRKVVEAATRVKLIQKIGEGTDKIDVAAAAERGIPVAKTTGGNAISVAELTVLLMLAALRRLPKAHNTVVAGQWLPWQLRAGCYEICGRQVGIVGLGKIGRLVARRVQGFEASVVYHDVARLPEAEEERLGVRYLPFDELLRTSDVVTLHVPLVAATRGLIGARALALMKPTAVLINACRGPVVDEEALYQALRGGKILGAGLDVLAKEPPEPTNPLFTLDNVVLTPHVGGGTEDAVLAGIRHAYSNIVRVSRGERIDPADLAPGSVVP